MRLTLTKRGEYGFRLMLYLAGREPGHRNTAAELAEACNIPPGNVPTIVNALSRAGILSCSPGRRGGCQLARAPEEITTLEVIEVLEGSLEIAHCFLDATRCHDHDPYCALHDAWSEGRAAAIGALARTSLADAAAREKEIEAELAARAQVVVPRSKTRRRSS